jgi:hypothetical protein
MTGPWQTLLTLGSHSLGRLELADFLVALVGTRGTELGLSRVSTLAFI